LLLQTLLEHHLAQQSGQTAEARSTLRFGVKFVRVAKVRTEHQLKSFFMMMCLVARHAAVRSHRQLRRRRPPQRRNLVEEDHGSDAGPFRTDKLLSNDALSLSLERARIPRCACQID